MLHVNHLLTCSFCKSLTVGYVNSGGNHNFLLKNPLGPTKVKFLCVPEDAIGGLIKTKL
jgi:hypothetical protein